LEDNGIYFYSINGGNDGLNTFNTRRCTLLYDRRLDWNQARIRDGMRRTTDMVVECGAWLFVTGFANSKSGKLLLPLLKGILQMWRGWGVIVYNARTPTYGGINIDTIDNLAKKNPNTITVKNPSRFLVLKKTKQFNYQGKPQLDFVRKNCQYHYRRFR
jgi:hypothetical protein